MQNATLPGCSLATINTTLLVHTKCYIIVVEKTSDHLDNSHNVLLLEIR